MDPAAQKLDRTRVEVEHSHLAAPTVSYMAAEDCWRLDQDYSYEDDGTQITVPAGFKFDLASIPRAFWWLIAPFELSITAPLIHDFLYIFAGKPPAATVKPYRSYTRKQVDTIYVEIMRQEGVAGWRRNLAYWAVRWFGRAAWGSKQRQHTQNQQD